jgi:Zn-finger nucleic acid-binding protein
MSISCPRCATSMATSVHPGPATGRDIEVDVCGECRGLWLDAAEIAQAYRDLGGEAARLRTHVGRGARTTTMADCPRCGAGMGDLAYFEVDIDLCPGCGGVWIDGPELEALSRSVDRHAGLAAPAPDAERALAAEATEGRVACSDCGAVVPLDRTLITGRGVMCVPCGERANERPSGDGAALMAELNYEDPDDPEVQLHRSAERRQGVVRVLGFIGQVLLAVLSAGGRCSRCGCSHHSHCHH